MKTVLKNIVLFLAVSLIGCGFAVSAFASPTSAGATPTAPTFDALGGVFAVLAVVALIALVVLGVALHRRKKDR